MAQKKPENKKDKPAMQPSSYMPFDMVASAKEWAPGYQPQTGSSSYCGERFDERFRWMPGHVNGWYGWPNDGKGTIYDFLSVVKSKNEDDWRTLSFKPEDLDTVPRHEDGKPKIAANRIYKNLAWTYTGKTFLPTYHEKWKFRGCEKMTFEEEVEAIKWVTKHFFVINPRDRRYKSMIDEIMYYIEYFGIKAVEIDPFNEVDLPEDERGDERLRRVFSAYKILAQETSTVVNIKSHAGKMRETKEKNGMYKVVTSNDQLGGSMWNIKMDGEFSIHKPFRHIYPGEQTVNFHNLKQRSSESVGAEKGIYDLMAFDKDKRQYLFDSWYPMSNTNVTPEWYKKHNTLDPGSSVPNQPTGGRKKKSSDAPPPHTERDEIIADKHKNKVDESPFTSSPPKESDGTPDWTK